MFSSRRSRAGVLEHEWRVPYLYVPHVTKNNAPYLTELLTRVRRMANPAMLMHMVAMIKM